MWQNKIDESIFDVCINSTDENCCIVFVNDLKASKAMIDSLGISIKCIYPLIKAFCIPNVGLARLIKLANLHIVNYISVVNSASAFMQRTNHVIKSDTLHRLGLSGKGVGVAVIDTGCFPHLDFLLPHKRNIVFVDMLNNKSNMYDDNGHGTFVCGALAGSGYSSGGVYCGVAPQCDLVVIKALDQNGKAQGLKILDAMQWVQDNQKRYHIKVVCMSFGSEPKHQFDALSLGAASLWDEGITVVSAVGNDGPNEGSIKSPAMSPKIISVGCVDTSKTVYKIADFSSRGPIFGAIKPDIVSPGVNVVSLDNSAKLFTTMNGTSVSAPVVAGVCALLLEYQPNLSPNELKSILLDGAVSVGSQPNAEGMGLVDAKRSLYSIKND